MAKRDYYEILGISKNASKDEIKKVYRNLALKYHPDRVPAEKKKESEEKFKEISEAYAVLSDEQKKSQYDQFGHEGIGARYSSEDIFRGADFSSIFEDLGFGGSIFEDVFSDFGLNIFGGRSSRRRGPRRGSDLQHDVEITFEEAAFGAERTFAIPRYETCSNCKGEGAAPGTHKVKCSKCNGSGKITSSHAFGFFISQTCNKCSGEGAIMQTPCPKCKGQGRLSVERKIHVKIPAGVETGMRIRISGEGEAGVRGGPRGDLYVLVYVKPHSIFQRQNDNILCEVPVGFVEAALGAEVEVPTLDGNVKMKVPAGTQSGKIFRLRGKGIQGIHGGGRGDEMVRVIVETPTNLTNEQKELLRRFQELSNDNTYPTETSFVDKIKHLFK
ncbi:MAG: molecular chaperone DnaJ [Candidatus Omnitrophota bacterium]